MCKLIDQRPTAIIRVIIMKSNQAINTQDSSPYMGLVKKGRGGKWGRYGWMERGGVEREEAGEYSGCSSRFSVAFIPGGGQSSRATGVPR